MIFMTMLIGIFAFAAGNFSQKFFILSKANKKNSALLFAALWMGLNGLGYLIYVLITGESISNTTVYCGILAGIMFAFASWSALYALENGIMSITLLIISFAVVVPTVLSVVFLGDKINFIQLLGIILMMIVFVIINYSPKGTTEKVNLKWLVITIICSLANGIIMYLSKLQQTYLPNQEQSSYFIFAFGVGSIVSFMLYLFTRKGKEKFEFNIKNFYGPAVITGAVIATGNLSQLLLAPVIPSPILFPTVQGSSVLISAIISCLFWGEKFKLQTAISIVIGLISVTLMNM